MSLNLLAAEADMQKVTFRYQAGIVPPSPYAQFLQTTELNEGVLPLSRVMEYRHFARRDAPAAMTIPAPSLDPLAAAAASASTGPAYLHLPPRRRSWGWAAAVLLLCLGFGGAGFFAGKMAGTPQSAGASGRTNSETPGGPTGKPTLSLVVVDTQAPGITLQVIDSALGAAPVTQPTPAPFAKEGVTHRS